MKETAPVTTSDPIDWLVPYNLFLVSRVIEGRLEPHPEYEDFTDAERYWRTVLELAGQPHAGDCTNQPATCIQCLIDVYRDEARRLEAFCWTTGNGQKEAAK
jgi:hypothetical protein